MLRTIVTSFAKCLIVELTLLCMRIYKEMIRVRRFAIYCNYLLLLLLLFFIFLFFLFLNQLMGPQLLKQETASFTSFFFWETTASHLETEHCSCHFREFSRDRFESFYSLIHLKGKVLIYSDNTYPPNKNEKNS